METDFLEQAFDEIAERLAKLRDQYGSETLALHFGTYRTTPGFGVVLCTFLAVLITWAL